MVNEIEFGARSALQDGTVRVTARLRNTADAPREITFPDGCVVLIRAYLDEAREGDPAWDQRQHAFCTMALQMVTLEPGESRSYEMTADAAEILGERLPHGLYHLAALLRPDGAEVEVPAGSVELSR